MKTILSKFSLLALSLFVISFTSLISCKKDKDDNPGTQQENLQGNWTLQSFKIDGVEAMGLVISASEMEFDSDSQFSWSITYTDNTGETVTGNYELNVSESKIIFKSADGEQLVFDFVQDGNIITLSGSLDEGNVVLKARRS